MCGHADVADGVPVADRCQPLREIEQRSGGARGTQRQLGCNAGGRADLGASRRPLPFGVPGQAARPDDGIVGRGIERCERRQLRAGGTRGVRDLADDGRVIVRRT